MKISKEKLYIAMARACLNTSELAEKAAMPKGTLNKIITGGNVFPVTAGKVARALGVDITELLED